MSSTMNSVLDTSCKTEIIKLVKLLRQNGDKVLSASSKLLLTTTLLNNLNEAFTLIIDKPEDLESSFQVCNSSKIEIFRDLKFLHDFIQKTVGLKIIHESNNNCISVDIKKFRHLKYLELKKVCISLVKGLQGVRGQLESIVCSGRKGVSSISQLLENCGGDNCAGFVWASLRHLALPHNTIEKLDNSLELATWLQILDLSHNLLTDAAHLELLPNLKYVNLGYNKLDTVPRFNKLSTHFLQVLVLKNNYIENIDGLQGLDCLTELDLSYNCLTNHSLLYPLEKMSTLLWISLEGNPLAYHQKHRTLTIKYLHPALSSGKFVLDHTPLSKVEKQLVMENRVFAIKPMSTQSFKNNSSTLLESSGSHSSTLPISSGITEESVIEIQNAEIKSPSKNLSKAKRKAIVKEAIITLDEHEKEVGETSNFMISSNSESTSDHLETKKQMIALREKFGEDNWLSSVGGTYIQNIMGLPTTSITTTNELLQEDSTLIPLTPENDNENIVNEAINDHTVNDVSINDDYSTENDINNLDEKRIDGLPTKTNSSENINLDEEEGDIYLVQKRKNENEMEELFLIIDSNNIKERDVITGRIKYTWSMNSVLSCVLGMDQPVTIDIIFDTARLDRQNRKYFLDEHDAKQIVSLVGERIRKRPVLLKVFKCMKCSTYFTQDTEYTIMATLEKSEIKQLKCTTCNSTLVIQVDELSSLDSENGSNLQRIDTEKQNFLILENVKKNNLKHSESFSSIGSATSLEESRESTPSTSTLMKKYESDIEILSNPSQSSIEVLDDASKANLTPKRKRSSEEKRTAVAPSLLTIPDTVSVMAGLTESSSSGSLTDSVCTAYENKEISQSNNSEKMLTEKETMFTPVTNLTSMLGGLLQSMKIGSAKSLPRSDEETVSFSSNIQYSYTDFSSVDHRIKLHIILNIFEHESEELILFLRADILMQSSTEIFPGCLVLSTSKIYILKIDGFEGEDPQRWLHKEVSWTMDRLRSLAPLPFKQGIIIELEQPSKTAESRTSFTLVCLLQDFQRTSNFLFYITDLSFPESCEVGFSVPEHCSISIHNLITQAKYYQEKDVVRLLALFSSATVQCQTDVNLKHSGLIVTMSTLLILEENLQWLIPSSKIVPKIAKEQSMTNLISVEHNDNLLLLNFLDEDLGCEEIWNLTFVSSDAAEAVIQSIRLPWEKLFSVPLQITTKNPQDV